MHRNRITIFDLFGTIHRLYIFLSRYLNWTEPNRTQFNGIYRSQFSGWSIPEIEHTKSETEQHKKKRFKNMPSISLTQPGPVQTGSAVSKFNGNANVRMWVATNDGNGMLSYCPASMLNIKHWTLCHSIQQVNTHQVK